MSNAVKKTISPPADLARNAEELARTEGKTLSGVIKDALRQAAIERRLQEWRGMQSYWSRMARDKGILTESDGYRYLRASTCASGDTRLCTLAPPCLANAGFCSHI